MPPKHANAPFAVDERVFCFHMDMLYEARILDVQQTSDGQRWRFRIHYKGWKNTWDDWVPQDRVRKFNDENRELAAQLRNQARLLQQQKNANKAPKKTTGGRLSGVGLSGATASSAGALGPASSGGPGAGSATPGDRTGRDHGHGHHHDRHAGTGRDSELASTRGSEERTAGTSLSHARGPRRQRDYDLEHVSWIGYDAAFCCFSFCCRFFSRLSVVVFLFSRLSCPRPSSSRLALCPVLANKSVTSLSLTLDVLSCCRNWPAPEVSRKLLRY